MMEWLINNIGTISAALILAAIVLAITVKLIKDKKKGKTSCGSGCAHCAMYGSCHKNN